MPQNLPPNFLLTWCDQQISLPSNQTSIKKSSSKMWDEQLLQKIFSQLRYWVSSSQRQSSSGEVTAHTDNAAIQCSSYCGTEWGCKIRTGTQAIDTIDRSDIMKLKDASMTRRRVLQSFVVSRVKHIHHLRYNTKVETFGELHTLRVRIFYTKWTWLLTINNFRRAALYSSIPGVWPQVTPFRLLPLVAPVRWVSTSRELLLLLVWNTRRV